MRARVAPRAHPSRSVCLSVSLCLSLSVSLSLSLSLYFSLSLSLPLSLPLAAIRACCRFYGRACLCLRLHLCRSRPFSVFRATARIADRRSSTSSGVHLRLRSRATLVHLA